MSDVLFLGVPVHEAGDVISMRSMPPPAIYTLAAVVRNAGYGVRVLDPSALRQVRPLSDPAKGFPDLIERAIKDVWVVGITATTTNWGLARYVAAEIHRRRPDLPIIFGGVHASYFDEYILRTTPASHVVRGEGETTIVPLLRAIESGGDLSLIPGLTWRRGSEVIRNPELPWLSAAEIQSTPVPAWDLLPGGVYHTLPVETSRGCRFSCRFCSVPRRLNWQGLDPAWVADRVTTVVREYGQKFRDPLVYFVDDCFTADGDRAGAIFERLAVANLPSKLVLEARATDLLQPGLLDRLSTGIVNRLAVGVECGYDEGLARVGKGLTMAKLDQSMQALLEHGLTGSTYCSFIIGFPWETERDCLKTVHEAARLHLEYGISVNLNWLILYPSRIWAERERYGIAIDESAFDDPTYLWDRDLFWRTHPNISPAIHERIGEVINSYQNSGCSLRSP